MRKQTKSGWWKHYLKDSENSYLPTKLLIEKIKYEIDVLDKEIADLDSIADITRYGKSWAVKTHLEDLLAWIEKQGGTGGSSASEHK